MLQFLIEYNILENIITFFRGELNNNIDKLAWLV